MTYRLVVEIDNVHNEPDENAQRFTHLVGYKVGTWHSTLPAELRRHFEYVKSNVRFLHGHAVGVLLLLKFEYTFVYSNNGQSVIQTIKEELWLPEFSCVLFEDVTPVEVCFATLTKVAEEDLKDRLDAQMQKFADAHAMLQAWEATAFVQPKRLGTK